MKIYKDYHYSFIGIFEILATDDFLISLNLVDEKEKTLPNKITKITKIWLDSYFDKKEPSWIPPVIYPKTTFAKKVINEVLNIPFGRCKSYSDIAKNIDNPKAYRAVAQVLKRNRYPLIIPCHRVISKKGIGGYNLGVGIKRKLLEFEKCELINF